MSFTNENLIISNSLNKEFAYLEIFDDKSMRYTLSLMEVLSSPKLSHILNSSDSSEANSSDSSETDIQDLVFDEFNKLKTEFILDGTGYSSRDEYFEKNKGKDEYELSNDFYNLYTSQLKKKEKSFAEFLKFLGINQENLGKNLDEIKGVDLRENEFYFFSKRPQTPTEISQNKRTAILYKISSNITWEAFDSFASQTDNIQTLITDIQNYLMQFSAGVILNPDAGTAQGIFPLQSYKYIDNVDLHEWTIDSIKTKDEYSKLMFESYEKSFGDFLKSHLRTSGKDLYSFKQISEAQKLNKLSLINLKSADIEALKAGNEDYSMLPNEVFDVLIAGYDLDKIKKLLFSEDFKIKNKDLFSYLDDMKITYYKEFNTNQSFKIRKFYDYKQDSRSLNKFFVICSLEDSVYKDSFASWGMSEDKIINFASPFNNSLFNLEIKKDSGVHEKEITISGNKRTYIFESGYNPDKTSFSSTSEAINYFIDKNQFIFAGKRYLITDQVNLDDDSFFYYDLFFSGAEDEAEIARLTEENIITLIPNLIATSTNLNDFESKLKTNKIDFNKREVYTKDVIRQDYNLIGTKEIKNVKVYYYNFAHYDSGNETWLRAAWINSSISSEEILKYIGNTQEEREGWYKVVANLEKYPKKILSFGGVSTMNSFIRFINNPGAFVNNGYHYSLDHYGVPTDENRYKKTFLYFNKLDNKFYEIELFTLLGEVEKDYLKKDSLFKKVDSNGMPLVNNNESFIHVGYFIEDNSKIKNLGSLDSIKTNEDYQKLLKVFKGKGYENIYDGMYFDNEGAKKLEDLLINNNLTSYAFTYDIKNLEYFFKWSILANETEVSDILKDWNFKKGSFEALDDYLRFNKIPFVKDESSFYNKEVQEKYNGVYYDLENGIKKKLEFLYYGEQYGMDTSHEPQHNKIGFHNLYQITMPEDTFKRTILLNKRDSIKNKYSIRNVGHVQPVRKHIDQYNMKYWFRYGYMIVNGDHIDSFKKTNVYYFDKTTKKLWKVGKDYTFLNRSGNYGSYESGLMQCRSYNDLHSWGMTPISLGFAFYDVTEEIDFSGQSLTSSAIQTFERIKNHVCYSHQEKGTVESMFNKYVPKKLIQLSDRRFAFPMDSSLGLDEEYSSDALKNQIEGSLKSGDSELLSKFRFFSEEEMNEITKSYNLLHDSRSSNSEIKISKDELERILG